MESQNATNRLSHFPQFFLLKLVYFLNCLLHVVLVIRMDGGEGRGKGGGICLGFFKICCESY